MNTTAAAVVLIVFYACSCCCCVWMTSSVRSTTYTAFFAGTLAQWSYATRTAAMPSLLSSLLLLLRSGLDITSRFLLVCTRFSSRVSKSVRYLVVGKVPVLVANRFEGKKNCYLFATWPWRVHLFDRTWGDFSFSVSSEFRSFFLFSIIRLFQCFMSPAGEVAGIYRKCT